MRGISKIGPYRRANRKKLLIHSMAEISISTKGEPPAAAATRSAAARLSKQIDQHSNPICHERAAGVAERHAGHDAKHHGTDGAGRQGVDCCGLRHMTGQH